VPFLNPAKTKPRAMLSWLFVGALFALCGVLGILQYRWIGEVSVASRERLRGSLQESLNRFSRDFDAELTAACKALMSSQTQGGVEGTEAAYAARYQQWKKTSRRSAIFSHIALAVPQGNTLALHSLDLERGDFQPAAWPAAWATLEARLEERLKPGPPQRRDPSEPASQDDGLVFELPLFEPPPRGDSPPPFRRKEAGWLIVEWNAEYLREAMLPELLQRHLETGGNLDYQVEIVTKSAPHTIFYQSDPDAARQIAGTADASVSLFDLSYDQILNRPGPPGMRRDGGRGGQSDSGRWQMYARHRAGSLEAVVASARWRNLAVTAGVLLLMVASLAALIRFTRHAQKLAALQMEFVAGVSHELRTPLTVIRTAAYNLRGKVAANPGQVEKYGALIEQESGRLTDLVEQVLRFASADAGRAVRNAEPLRVDSLIDATMESSKVVIEASRCQVEKRVESGLPPILGDPMALKHALQNLLSNAAKYGGQGDNWIGVSASRATHRGQTVVEIRVADHGPGIPSDEQGRIFDPFFRGKRAVQDQIHGTGLGLSLVKGIIKAHGGTIDVHSEPAKGAEFVIRLPAAPAEYQDELAHSSGRG